MSKETFAIINDQDQVVNHIVIDKDDANFESNMADQLARWGCVRYVETDLQTDIIVLDESPEIWTTHTDATGFVLPQTTPTPVIVPTSKNPADYDHEIVIINDRVYPADSLLIRENASSRPAGWVLPSHEVEVSLSDAE
jgi:hypothetical protein